MRPSALITGALGQDGRYLQEFLLDRGYAVIGLARSVPAGVAPPDGVSLVEGDITDPQIVFMLFRDFEFSEVYNLAGPSFGPASWDDPAGTAEVLGVAVVRLLEAIRSSARPIRMFQASSSELFGEARESPQQETTPFHPISPYGFAKAYAHDMVSLYRSRFRMFACCGILFNHESPLRRPEFVTRKIARHAAMAALGVTRSLRLGSLEAQRDWGFAGDHVEAMWMMLQHKEPGDYVVATGESHTVRELCDLAFAHVGLRYQDFVVEDPDLYRPNDVQRRGDPSKIKRILGWEPRVTFRELVSRMVDADLALLRAEGRSAIAHD